MLLRMLHVTPLLLTRAPPSPLVHSTAVLVGSNVHLGDDVEVEAGAVVGPDVDLGVGTKVGANAVVANTTTGPNCEIGAGCTVGQDGFGWIPAQSPSQRPRKKPQELRVELGSDVVLGARCSIARGSWRNTVLGSGTKIDAAVHIGHNVVLGESVLVAGQAGIAGSVTVGDRCMIGGQAGIAQHLTLADKVSVAAQSGVTTDVLEPGAVIGGTPAVPIREYHRQTVFLRRNRK